MLGTGAGALLKIAGDATYDTARTAWIQHRKYTLDNSKEKILDIRKPAFHPKDSKLLGNLSGGNRGKSIIPSGPGGKLDAPRAKAEDKENDRQPPPPKKGWLW